jgi:hypothetical protein
MADLLALLADFGGGMITSMGRDRTQQATPDLLSTAQMLDLGGSSFLPTSPLSYSI